MSEYYNPVKIIKTDNWYSELSSRMKNLKISSPIIITTPGNRKRLKLDSKFNVNSIFSNVDINPNLQNCNNVIKFCKKNIYDGVIAIGGGSAMDLAKVAVAHLCIGESDIYKLIEYEKDFPKKLPSIFLPTTHGTASEVTMWGTIWNIIDKKKYSISHNDLYPSVAILDGNLTISLPIDISIATVLDSLSHSFESIWNKNANETSTKYAIKAIGIILNNIEKFKESPSDLNIRQLLLEASTTAGLAFSNTKTAAAHSISYPLTLHYNIPHGIASSISLVPLLAINGPSIQDSLDVIYDKYDLSYQKIIKSIKSIPKGIIPFSLNEWGISIDHIPRLAKESFTKGRMDNNLVDLSINDVKSILKDLYTI